MWNKFWSSGKSDKKETPEYDEMSMEDFLKHPLIMDPNHVPTQEEIEENQFLQSIQAMKYSEDDTPDEQAQAHKEDGTFHFKAKLYKKACIGYSKAISINPPNKTLLVRDKWFHFHLNLKINTILVA